jgi:hypothetical protein
MAQTSADCYGTARATADLANATQGQSLIMQANNRGDQLVALALPQRAEMARLGQLWTCRMATGSAFTYVAAWPTTRGELVLYNGEASNGKSYIIDKAWMYGITSMAAAQLINSHNGKASYSGYGRVAVANTAAGQIANLWDVLASANAPMTTNLGQAVVADLWGQYIIPPGGVFALAGIAGTAAGTATIGVTWAEVQLALG